MESPGTLVPAKNEFIFTFSSMGATAPMEIWGSRAVLTNFHGRYRAHGNLGRGYLDCLNKFRGALSRTWKLGKTALDPSHSMGAVAPMEERGVPVSFLHILGGSETYETMVPCDAGFSFYN